MFRKTFTRGPQSPEHKEKLRQAKLGKKGAAANAYKGGRIVNNRYVRVLITEAHPLFKDMAQRWGKNNYYISEHRLIMAEHLGRPLERKWVVHHKWFCEGGTHDPLDNRIENLVCFASAALHFKWESLLRKKYGTLL